MMTTLSHSQARWAICLCLECDLPLKVQAETRKFILASSCIVYKSCILTSVSPTQSHQRVPQQLVLLQLSSVHNGLTPLMLASHQGKRKVALALLDLGADVNGMGVKQQTALGAALEE